jgi:uncharacterized membrane protein
VVARPPLGVTAVPVELDFVLSVTTPSLLLVCCDVVELEPPSNGTTGVVVCVVVELEDDCAAATPVSIARAAVAASHVLIMLFSPWNHSRAAIAHLLQRAMWGAEQLRDRVG